MHITKDGKRIRLEDLTDNHLNNIIKMINSKADRGIVVKYYGGRCPDDYYYSEEELHGQQVLSLLKYDKYIKEYNRRKQETCEKRVEEDFFNRCGTSFQGM